MDELEKMMTEVQDEAAGIQANRMPKQEKQQLIQKQIEQLIALFDEFASHVEHGDEKLETKVTKGNAPGVIIGFLDSHFSTARYVVKSVCQINSVQVSVTDGRWEEMPSQHGLWGNWSDERIIYSGKFRDAPIREALERTFMVWYKWIKKNGVQGIPEEQVAPSDNVKYTK